MIRVQIAGQEARMDSGEWTARNPILQRVLRTFHRGWMTSGIHGDDPDPDYSAAMAAVKTFNGKVLSLEDHREPDHVRGRKY